jgi:hypothetical protein
MAVACLYPLLCRCRIRSRVGWGACRYRELLSLERPAGCVGIWLGSAGVPVHVAASVHTAAKGRNRARMASKVGKEACSWSVPLHAYVVGTFSLQRCSFQLTEALTVAGAGKLLQSSLLKVTGVHHTRLHSCCVSAAGCVQVGQLPARA